MSAWEAVVSGVGNSQFFVIRWYFTGFGYWYE